MFAGVAVICISLPITGVMASFARKLQLQQMQDKDKRIKLLNEILSGIKVIKMYGWDGKSLLLYVLFNSKYIDYSFFLNFESLD